MKTGENAFYKNEVVRILHFGISQGNPFPEGTEYAYVETLENTFKLVPVTELTQQEN